MAKEKKEKKPRPVGLRVAGYVADGLFWNNHLAGVPGLVKNIKKGEAADKAAREAK